MKIGLISINIYTSMLNFASVLHTFAFQQYLESKGIESTILDYKPVYFGDYDLRHPSLFLKQRVADAKEKLPYAYDSKMYQKLCKQIENDRYLANQYEKIYEERETRCDKFFQFIEKYYKKTDKCYNSDLLEIEDPGFDCYICVTDVIWKRLPGWGYDRGFFLGSKAMDNKWKVAYSAGRGPKGPKTKAQEDLFFYYLSDMDYISVREETLKDYIENHSDLKVQQVLDPVLLHDASFYEKIAVQPQEEKYVLLYYVMETADETVAQALNYAKKHGLPIVEISDKPVKEGYASGNGVTTITKYDIGIEEWLGYIQYAECVFTNSFHGACLSILFEKKFYTGPRNSDKVACLMQYFGLEYRMITGETDLFCGVNQIDWAPVRKRLHEGRNISDDFLLTALCEIDGKAKTTKAYESYRKNQKYKVSYQVLGCKKCKLSGSMTDIGGKLQRVSSDTYAFVPEKFKVTNRGKRKLMTNPFVVRHHQFIGWKIRVKIDAMWFWLQKDGTLRLMKEDAEGLTARILKEGSRIPYIDVNHIEEMVVEAVYRKQPSLTSRITNKVKRIVKKSK